MRIPLIATALAAAPALAVPAVAAPLTHDAQGEFVTYAAGTRVRAALNAPSFRGTQGQQRNGTAVPAGRSDIDFLFPGGAFFSMGIGANLDPRVAAITSATAGTLSLTIAPHAGRRITGATWSEVTNPGRDTHAEALWVFLGQEAAPFETLAGLVWTEDAGSGAAGRWQADPSRFGLSAANIASGDGGLFALSVLSGDYTTLSFLDASFASFTLPGLGRNLRTYSTTQDGFDVDMLSVTSDLVPAPAAVALFGLGAGVCAMRRVRRR
jgi:hypothetical protein